MKFLNYIARNARRNPVRTLLTVASIGSSLFLMMILVAYLSIGNEVSSSLKLHNRVVAMSAQGFARPLPLALVREVEGMAGVAAASPFSWYGGKVGEETVPFAQFGVDPDVIFAIYDELTVPADQLKAFRGDRAGCVIGRKLAEERGWKVGDPLPLKGTIYPFDLNLTIRGIYDGPADRNPRMCFFNQYFLDDGLKSRFQGRQAGVSGTVLAKCKDAAVMPAVVNAIDESTRNSDNPTRTQTEEAFGKMFSEMLGDMRTVLKIVCLAVVGSLLCVASVAMAMSMRERTSEVAVLKAIGYGRGLVLCLVLAEAVLIAGVGGLLGAGGAKLLFDLVDISPYTGGMLPFFFIPRWTALAGLAIAPAIGLLSGLIPAIRAATLPVVDGLRKVV